MGSSLALRDTMLGETLLNPRVYRQLFVSLHVGDPMDNGGNEVTGGAYARMPAEFGRSAPATASNVGPLEYDDLPEVRVSYFGIWDSQEGGQFLVGGPLLTARTVQDAGALRWRSGDLVLRLG